MYLPTSILKCITLFKLTMQNVNKKYMCNNLYESLIYQKHFNAEIYYDVVFFIM
jgi:hypothetical protein